jgi:hypothetical protein
LRGVILRHPRIHIEEIDMPKDKKTKQKERERRVAKQKLEARKAARDKALEEAQKPKSQFAKFVTEAIGTDEKEADKLPGFGPAK